VVFKLNRILWNLITTPSAPTAVASRHFINVASTPPRRGGENRLTPRLGNSPLGVTFESIEGARNHRRRRRLSELAPGIVKDCKTGKVTFNANSGAYRRTSTKFQLQPVLSLHALPQSKGRPLFRKELEMEKSLLKSRDKQTK
jgi:hypothetical protein